MECTFHILSFSFLFPFRFIFRKLCSYSSSSAFFHIIIISVFIFLSLAVLLSSKRKDATLILPFSCVSASVIIMLFSPSLYPSLFSLEKSISVHFRGLSFVRERVRKRDNWQTERQFIPSSFSVASVSRKQGNRRRGIDGLSLSSLVYVSVSQCDLFSVGLSLLSLWNCFLSRMREKQGKSILSRHVNSWEWRWIVGCCLFLFWGWFSVHLCHIFNFFAYLTHFITIPLKYEHFHSGRFIFVLFLQREAIRYLPVGRKKSLLLAVIFVNVSITRRGDLA